MEERKGFMVEWQQELLDTLWKNKGLMEVTDGIIIRIGDDIGGEKVKDQIPEQYHALIYEFVDTLFEALKPLAEPK